MNVQEIIEQCVHHGAGFESAEARIYAALLDNWATLKDYEVKHQLLKTLVLRYSAVERNLTELNEQLVSVNQLKNRFLGIAAHDLRSPLSSIRGLSEIMLTEAPGALNTEQTELISTIFMASRDMLALVNDLLDISVIESGHLDLKLRREAVEPLLRERLKIFRVAAEARNVRFVVDCQPLPEVLCDRSRIAQAIDNLLGNAVKFSPCESIIEISLRAHLNFVRVGVRDQGPGIAAEDQALIFGEFHTVSGRAGGDGAKGTGLGLAIVKRIIEAHRGTVDVASEPGAG